ncbi:mutator type transposase [Tanacetum coccineum]
MECMVKYVEKNEESESGSDSASESDNDFEDEEHVVQEVEVNMGYFNFQVEDASTGTDGNMIPVAPKFYIGKEFANRDVAKDLIRTHAVESRRNLHFLRNDPIRIRVVCNGVVPCKNLVTYKVPGPNVDNAVKGKIVNEDAEEDKITCPWLLYLSKGDKGKWYDFDLYSNSNFTFITDRQKGLLPALEKLFPHAEHRHAIGSVIIHNHFMFEKNNKVLKDFNKKAYEWLKQIPAEHWSRAYFSGRAHCDLEHVKGIILMKRIVVVQKIIEKCDGPLTPAVARVFDIIKEASSECIVDWNGADQYQVKGYLQEQYVVNLNQRTCSCRKWEISGIPCKHAIAAIHDMADNGNDVGIPEDWVHDSYKLATWSLCFQPKSSTDLGTTIKGERRVKEDCDGEGNKLTRQGKTVICSLCHATGHNKRSYDRRQPSQGGTSNAAGVGTQPSEGETSNAAGVGPLASQGGTSNAAGVGTQASQGGTSNTAGTKRKSKGSTGTSNAAGTQASQASKGGTSNAATQASTGSPLKRTKKSASRLTPEK